MGGMEKFGWTLYIPQPEELRAAVMSKFSKRVGIAMAILSAVWLLITRLFKHIVLTWVAEHLGGPAMLNWAIEHPFKIFLTLSLSYCLLIVFLSWWRSRKRVLAKGPLPLSPAEAKSRIALKTEFDAMPWPQKLALRLIYQRPIVSLSALEKSMRNYGFGKDPHSDILVPLSRRVLFVKSSDAGEMEKHPSHTKIVEELLAEWEKHPFQGP